MCFLALAADISVGVPLAAYGIAFVASLSSEFLDRVKVQQLFYLLVGDLGKFRRHVVAKFHTSLGASSSLEISSKSRYVCIFFNLLIWLQLRMQEEDVKRLSQSQPAFHLLHWKWLQLFHKSLGLCSLLLNPKGSVPLF